MGMAAMRGQSAVALSRHAREYSLSVADDLVGEPLPTSPDHALLPHPRRGAAFMKSNP